MRSFRFVFPAVALFAASCGNDKDLPPLLGAGSANAERAQALYQQAKESDDAGKRDKAIKLYDKLADEMPLAAQAPDARFRQAELLEEAGKTREAFDAYQNFIDRYNGSGLYERALSRQAAMAQAAADGNVKTSFLGLKSRIPNEKIAEMLTKVRQNAPRSPIASKAQFTIGEIWENDRNRDSHKRAIAAYRELVIEYPDSKEAPEGQFRIGKILLDEANRGNHDQANLDRAREAFQDYLRLYPGHSRNGEARQFLANLGGQDIQRSFNIAEFYEKKGDIGSARYYYEEVVNKAKSGDLHNKAKARLAALGGNEG